MGQARTAQQCSWECVGAETYVCVDATWRPFGNGRRNKRPKIALPFLRAICFAEILWKFLGRTGSRATVGQLHGPTDGRTDRSAGTGCHVGDIWPNCALMCVCARVCVRHVCVRVCVLEQIANGKWPQMFYIFLFAACALISDCYITFHLMLSCSKDIKESLSVCQLYLSFQLFASLFP